jgi:hypothetical protein
VCVHVERLAEHLIAQGLDLERVDIVLFGCVDDEVVAHFDAQYVHSCFQVERVDLDQVFAEHMDFVVECRRIGSARCLQIYFPIVHVDRIQFGQKGYVLRVRPNLDHIQTV